MVGRVGEKGANRPVDAFDRLRTDVLEGERQQALNVSVCRFREANGFRAEPAPAGEKANIDTVPEDVAIPDHDFADVHSDAEDDPMFLRDRIVHRCDAFLNGQGASNCVKGVRELGEYAVPRRIGDAPPVLSDFAVRDLAM